MFGERLQPIRVEGTRFVEEPFPFVDAPCLRELAAGGELAGGPGRRSGQVDDAREGYGRDQVVKIVLVEVLLGECRVRVIGNDPIGVVQGKRVADVEDLDGVVEVDAVLPHDTRGVRPVLRDGARPDPTIHRGGLACHAKGEQMTFFFVNLDVRATRPRARIARKREPRHVGVEELQPVCPSFVHAAILPWRARGRIGIAGQSIGAS